MQKISMLFVIYQTTSIQSVEERELIIFKRKTDLKMQKICNHTPLSCILEYSVNYKANKTKNSSFYD